jgi:hypothetical protein
VSLIGCRPVNSPVSRDDEACHPLRVLDREPQPDRAAPVVHHEGGFAEVELLDQRAQQVGVAVVGVPVRIDRLVRAAEARHVGGDRPEAGIEHGRNHFSPQERPGRLAVEEHDRRARALVQVSQPQPVDAAVMAAERKIGQSFQQLIGCPDRVDHARNATPPCLGGPIRTT